MAPQSLLGITILALALSQALAFDPSPLQDFCVADKKSDGMVEKLILSFFSLLACVKE